MADATENPRCERVYDLMRLGSEVMTDAVTLLVAIRTTEDVEEQAKMVELSRTITRATALALELARAAEARGEEVYDPAKASATAAIDEENGRRILRLSAASDQRLAKILDGKVP